LLKGDGDTSVELHVCRSVDEDGGVQVDANGNDEYTAQVEALPQRAPPAIRMSVELLQKQ